MSTFGAVVIDYRTPDEALGCLRSLTRSTQAPGALTWLRIEAEDQRPMPEQVRELRQADNPGFAATVNRIARRAAGDGLRRLLISNADVRFHPEALARLSAALDSAGPGTAAVAPVLLDACSGRGIEAAGVRIDRRSGRVRMRRHGEVWRGEAATPQRVPILFTACLLDLPAFLSVGGLDEGYFLYFEDIDFCLRAEAAGLQTLLVPDAIAWHRGNRGAQRLRYATRNHLRLLGGRNPLRAGFIAGTHLLQALRSPPLSRRAALSATLEGIAAAWRRPTGPL